MSRLLVLIRPLIRTGCRRRGCRAIRDANRYIRALTMEPPDTTRHALLELAFTAAEVRAQVWLALSGDEDVTIRSS